MPAFSAAAPLSRLTVCRINWTRGSAVMRSKHGAYSGPLPSSTTRTGSEMSWRRALGMMIEFLEAKGAARPLRVLHYRRSRRLTFSRASTPSWVSTRDVPIQSRRPGFSFLNSFRRTGCPGNLKIGRSIRLLMATSRLGFGHLRQPQLPDSLPLLLPSSCRLFSSTTNTDILSEPFRSPKAR